MVAGHSVGEIAAYAIAGVISADDAIKLAATRGAEMAKACALEPTGMSAVLGGEEADVLARLEQLDLVAANRNAAGQIVAAGALAALDKLAEDPPAKARVRQLATAGAFHTHYMASATDGYSAAAEAVTIRRAHREAPVERRWATRCLRRGRDGQAGVAADPARALGPVHRDLRQQNVTAIVEFPPAGTLAGHRQTRTSGGADARRQVPR